MNELDLLKKGNSCFLVRLNDDYSNADELIKYLYKNGYKAISYQSSLPRGPWIYVNVETNVFRYGTVGIAIVPNVVGNHAVSVADFISINEIFKSYSNIPFLKLS